MKCTCGHLGTSGRCDLHPVRGMPISIDLLALNDHTYGDDCSCRWCHAVRQLNREKAALAERVAEREEQMRRMIDLRAELYEENARLTARVVKLEGQIALLEEGIDFHKTVRHGREQENARLREALEKAKSRWPELEVMVDGILRNARQEESKAELGSYPINSTIQKKLYSEEARQVTHPNGEPASISYDEGLKERLKDPEYAEVFEKAKAEQAVQGIDKKFVQAVQIRCECGKVSEFTGACPHLGVSVRAAPDPVSRDPNTPVLERPEREQSVQDTPKIEWRKNDFKNPVFTDGSEMLIALQTNAGIDIDRVKFNCDGDGAYLEYPCGCAYDAWVWDDVDFFAMLDGDPPQEAEEESAQGDSEK